MRQESNNKLESRNVDGFRCFFRTMYNLKYHFSGKVNNLDYSLLQQIISFVGPGQTLLFVQGSDGRIAKGN
jgi:hypothetical protein